MNKILQKKPVVIFLAIFCCALWGSAFPCIKTGYKLFNIAADETSKQILFAGIRFFFAGIFVIITGSLFQKKLLIPKSGKTLSHIFLLSLLQTIMQYIFFYVGLAHTTGSKAAIVEAINVFVALLVSCCLFKFETITVRKIIGCIIGFAGVVIINITSNGFTAISITGEGFILFSTIAYAFSSVLIKYYSKSDDTVMLSGYQFIAGGLVMIFIGYILGGRLEVPTIAAMTMLFYLAFISATAYSIWGLLLKYNPISTVAVFGFSNPVFGVILSAIILHEKPDTLKSAISLILISTGIFVVNKKNEELDK